MIRPDLDIHALPSLPDGEFVGTANLGAQEVQFYMGLASPAQINIADLLTFAVYCLSDQSFDEQVILLYDLDRGLVLGIVSAAVKDLREVIPEARYVLLFQIPPGLYYDIIYGENQEARRVIQRNVSPEAWAKILDNARVYKSDHFANEVASTIYRSQQDLLNLTSHLQRDSGRTLSQMTEKICTGFHQSITVAAAAAALKAEDFVIETLADVFGYAPWEVFEVILLTRELGRQEQLISYWRQEQQQLTGQADLGTTVLLTAPELWARFP